MIDLKLEQEWRERMESFAREGLSIRGWCRVHKVPEPRFYYWRRRFAASGDGLKEKPNWCALEVECEKATAVGDCGIAIYMGAARIEVKPGFDAQALRAVVQALESARC